MPPEERSRTSQAPVLESSPSTKLEELREGKGSGATLKMDGVVEGRMTGLYGVKKAMQRGYRESVAARH